MDLAATAIEQPALARVRAISRPMPREAPVIKATRPCSGGVVRIGEEDGWERGNEKLGEIGRAAWESKMSGGRESGVMENGSEVVRQGSSGR